MTIDTTTATGVSVGARVDLTATAYCFNEGRWNMGKRNRSAVTGRFVKPSTARRNPRTTVTETTKKRR